MKARPMITLAAGLVLASAAVFLVSRQMDRPSVPQANSAPAMKLSDVVVATSNLEFGSRIKAEHVRVARWPADARPEGAFSSVEELLGDGDPPRAAIDRMARGEPVLRSKVSGFGERASMSTRIPEGKRAFAIRVNAVSGVAGFLLPGDRVDVMLTRQAGARGSQVNHVVIQDVKVRGVDQIADEDRNKPQVARTVTVEVTPREAQKLALASEVGNLSLALRNMHSADKAQTRTINVADLQDGVERGTRPSGPSVRVRRGNEVSVVRVPAR